jgi:hypothetical protein
MQLKQIAKTAHEINRAYCLAIGDDSQPSWEDAPQWQRDSAIAGVAFHMANPDAKPSDSHESWLKQKEEEGWKYGPVKNPETKEHPCYVPYDELPVEQKAKDYLFIAVVRSLVAQQGNGNSIGEVRVRTKFNPSNDGLVDTLKQKTAELINLCQSIKNEEVSKDYDKAPNESREANGEVIRWVALAQTAYEEAAMYAVKAATA